MTLLTQTLLCIAVALASGETPARGSIGVCLDVAEAAQAESVPPALALVIAWHETRWRNGLVSSAGACGPMQVIARIHGDCSAATGVRVLRRYLLRRWRDGRPLGGAVCDYACGPARRFDDCTSSRERLAHLAEVQR